MHYFEFSRRRPGVCRLIRNKKKGSDLKNEWCTRSVFPHSVEIHGLVRPCGQLGAQPVAQPVAQPAAQPAAQPGQQFVTGGDSGQVFLSARDDRPRSPCWLCSWLERFRSLTLERSQASEAPSLLSFFPALQMHASQNERHDLSIPCAKRFPCAMKTHDFEKDEKSADNQRASVLRRNQS